MVGDKENVRVAFVLCELLDETNNSLTAAILDVLGDLSLPISDAAEIRLKVVKRLPTVPLETVPILLTFIFKRIQTDEALDIIKEVGLHFDKIFKKRHERISKETVTDCISLSMESLQSSMIGSKSLSDTWIKGNLCSYIFFSSFSFLPSFSSRDSIENRCQTILFPGSSCIIDSA